MYFKLIDTVRNSIENFSSHHEKFRFTPTITEQIRIINETKPKDGGKVFKQPIFWAGPSDKIKEEKIKL